MHVTMTMNLTNVYFYIKLLIIWNYIANYDIFVKDKMQSDR